MIKITKRNLHLVLGILHLAAYSDPNRCFCEKFSTLYTGEARDFTDYIIQGAIGREEKYIILNLAHDLVKERNPDAIIYRNSECVHVSIVLEVVEKMLADGEIVVAD